MSLIQTSSDPNLRLTTTDPDSQSQSQKQQLHTEHSTASDDTVDSDPERTSSQLAQDPSHGNVISPASMELESDSASASASHKTLVKQPSIVIGAILSILAGAIFGFAMQKTYVFVPDIVQEQFTFNAFVMVKVFMAASATGTVCFVLVSLLLPDTFEHAMQKSYNFPNAPLSAGVGGAMIGIGGFVIAGSCPGTVYAQMGSLVKNSQYTYLGGIAGALLYGLLHPHIKGFTTWGAPKTTTLHRYLGVSYAKVAIPLALACIGVLLGLEFGIDTTDTEKAIIPPVESNIFTSPSWAAYSGGIVMGLLQFPMMVVLHKHVGTSTSYVILSSTVLRAILPRSWTKDKEWFQYFAGKHIGTKTGWQLSNMAGLFGGAMLAAALSSTLGDFDGYSPLASFVGGMIMVFGGRLGGGCTSGHGLSGVSKLQFASFASAAGMFGAAIPAAYLYEYVR
jgi:uncharacterized membrane protein YedE/YeeE